MYSKTVKTGEFQEFQQLILNAIANSESASWREPGETDIWTERNLKPDNETEQGSLLFSLDSLTHVWKIIRRWIANPDAT